MYYIKPNYYFYRIEYYYIKHFYVLYKEVHIYCNFLRNVLVTTLFLLLIGRLHRTSMRNVSYIHTYVHETRRTFYKDTHTSDTRTRTHACTHMSARANTLTHTLHTSYYTEIYIYMRAYYAFTHMLRFVYINIHIPFLVFHLRTLYIRKFVSISRRNTFERRFV